MKSRQKEQIAQITHFEPQAAGINLQSPQSNSTPRETNFTRLARKQIPFEEPRIGFTIDTYDTKPSLVLPKGI